MSFLPLFLQAADSSSAGAAGAIAGGGMISFVPMILIIVIMYFLMIRPQSKKQKETQKMLDALKKGDKVITVGGIHGTVTAVKENVVTVKVDDSTKIQFNRTAIATVVTEGKAASDQKDEGKPGDKAAVEQKDSENTDKAEWK